MRDGRLRTLWRVLLFVVLFIAVLWLELLAVAAAGFLPPLEDRVSLALVLQSALLLVAALAVGRIMLRWVDRRPDAVLGFGLDRSVPRALATGVAAGAAALAIVVAAFAWAGLYAYTAEPGTWEGWLARAAFSLAMLAIPAAAEEALFRGYLFRTLVDGSGPATALALTSAVFAAVHGANPGAAPFAIVNIFLAGVLLGVGMLRTGSLWFATAVHLGWNWMMAGPLDLPVSGLEGFDVPLYDVTAAGPTWITGGEFGPEGGLAGTLAVGLGLLLVIRMTRPGSALAGTLNDGGDRVRDR